MSEVTGWVWSVLEGVCNAYAGCMNLKLAAVILTSIAALLCGACVSTGEPRSGPPPDTGGKRSKLEVQALVMKMADDYSGALVEALDPVFTSEASNATARHRAQTVLRNGISSALDIATGPNPDASLLDLLVLVSLQRWAVGAHWAALGLPEGLEPGAEARLRIAEAALWKSASGVLSDAQQETLRSLIDAWITANPERQFVSFVRFEEFVDIRNQSTLGNRTKAEGLFREVSEATLAVDEARLFGERALWFAARYPQVAGLQAEQTLYRLAGQPELRTALESLESLKNLGASLSSRIELLDRDLAEQQDLLFAKLSTERDGAIRQFSTSLDGVFKRAMDDLDTRIASARDATIQQSFDRFATERKELLHDLDSKQAELHGLMADLREAMSASNGLAKELTGTVNALDRVVARFDEQPGTGKRPLDIKDFRETALAATQAADRLTVLLEKTSLIADPALWDQRLTRLDRSTAGLVDRAFWLALVLVLTLVGGLAVVRLIPGRPRASTAAGAP